MRSFHQIVDRPPVTAQSAPSEPLDVDEKGIPRSGTLPPGYRIPGRVYVQPQWIWDCINEAKLLRPDLYAPGNVLPPHLSPWVKAKKGQYDPRAPLEEQEREGEVAEFEEEEAEAAAIEAAEASGSEEEDEDEEDAESANEAMVEDDHGMDVDLAESEESDSGSEGGNFDGFEEELAADESEDEETKERNMMQAELEAEAAGYTNGAADGKNAKTADGKPLRSILKAQASKGNEARKRAEKKKREEQEELQRNMGMMSRKKRKLMEKMQYGNQKKEEEAEKLRKKRRKLEKQKATEKAATAV
jgi:pescadillo protein